MIGRLLTVTAAAAAAAVTVAGCGAVLGATAGHQQTITVYNGQHEETTRALAAAVTRQTGIGVTIRSDDEDVLTQQIRQEGPPPPPT
jgi:iron(III) transport system substrate-binding protein